MSGVAGEGAPKEAVPAAGGGGSIYRGRGKKRQKKNPARGKSSPQNASLGQLFSGRV